MTYRTKAEYAAACDALAAHLDTLTDTQISEIYADGSTTDAEGRVWEPAASVLVEPDTDGTWFIEAHGAAARFEGGSWVGREPGATELTDMGLAVWGEDSDNFGYPI